MFITLEPVSIPESGPFNLELKLTTNIQITADRARRKVSVYAGNHIADLLSGETPGLVWRRNRAYWRVPVILTTRSKGRVGVVGTIDVDVETGELQVNSQLVEEIGTNADNLVISAALDSVTLIL
jgi:hypothetical protein